LLGPPLGACGERLAERRKDGQIDDSARLLIPKLDRGILLNVLAAEPRRIADPEAGVEQDRIDKPLVRAERINPLELREFFFAPCLVAVLFVDAGLLGLRPLIPSQGLRSTWPMLTAQAKKFLSAVRIELACSEVSFRISRASMMTDLVMSSVS
jgi:hypothetical protein